MATRDLGFNVFANADKALEALARASNAVDRLADRIIRLGNTKANPKVTIDTAKIEAEIARVEKKLDELRAKKADPTIDANITLAETKITRLTAEIERLKNMRADPKIDPQIADAQAKIDDLTRKLEALGRQRPSVVVTMQSALINNEIATLQAKLAALNAQRVDPKVDLQISELEAKVVLVQAKLDELRVKKADVKIDADIKEFEAKLVLLMAQLAAAKAAGGKINVGGSSTLGQTRSLTQQVGLLSTRLFEATRSAASLANNFRGMAIIFSLSAGIPTIVSLADTLATAAQAALLLPGAFAAGAAAVTVLGIAFSGFVKALGPTTTPAQIKQVELAMSKLSPTARDLVTTIRSLAPAWHSLKMEIQDDMFKNVAPSFKAMALTYLPVFKSGLGQIAVEMNKTVVELMKWLQGTAQVSDTQRIFHNTALAIDAMRPATIAVGSAFKNLAVVGTEFLPGISKAFTNVAFEFDHFIEKARNDGSLRLWIAQGMMAVRELGTLVANVGHIFGDLFSASEKAGASTISILNDAISALHQFFSSVQGQSGLVNLFQGIHQTIEAIKPGVVAVFGAIADAIGIIRPTVVQLGVAFSALAGSLAPAVPMIAKIVADIGGPLLAAITAVINTFGGLLPIILTATVAFKALALAGGLLATLGAGIGRLGAALGTAATAAAVMGTSMGMSNAAMTGLANAGQKAESGITKFGNAVSKAGAALPLVGAAIIIGMQLIDSFSTHYTESADAVIKGSMSMQQAIDKETAALNANAPEWLGNANAQEHARQATADLNIEISKQLDAMTPLARAQAEVTIAEGRYQDAVAKSGASSKEAADAAANVAMNKEHLRVVTEAAATATRTETEVMVDNARQVAAAADADLAMEQSQLRLERQIQTTTQALKNHSASSIEGRQATLDLRQAYLDVAVAAQRKAEADAQARGEADSAAQGARAYRDKLIELASQASGPTRQALLDMARAATTAGDAEGQARVRALEYQDQLLGLAANASGKVRTDILALAQNFNNLGGAHATAQQRADAQRQALINLANQASGPLRAALLAMADQVRTLPDKTVTVTATGVLSGADLLRASHGGFTGGIIDVDGPTWRIKHKYASGGVLPGYTPGRDVHHFSGPTGNLSLSGGEAIMRPEWTRAMGPGYVHGANRAARSGGVAAVRSFHSSALANGGIVASGGGSFATGGVFGDQSFATGGLVYAGRRTDAQLAVDDYNQTTQAAIKILAPYVQSLLKQIMAQMAAAAAAIGAVAGGGGAVSAGGAKGWIIAHESGGNPRAQNPVSSASGLFQLIDGTWHAYGGVEPHAKDGSVAEQNAVADRYVAARYGSWEAAQQFWMAHHWYDDGGLASGAGLLMKMTQRPERVLSPRQTEAFERMVGALESIRSQATSTGTPVPDSAATATEVNRLRSDIQVLGETIRETVKTARPITVEDHSGDPKETGRAVSLALRL